MDFVLRRSVPNPYESDDYDDDATHVTTLRASQDLLMRTVTIRKSMNSTPRLGTHLCIQEDPSSCFMDVPAEIRIEIYKALVQPVRCSVALTAFHSLRLTSRQIKHELDFEYVRYSVAQMTTAINYLKQPLGYSSSVQDGIPRHEFWSTTRPMLTMNPVPKMYSEIRNLHLTTLVSDYHMQLNDTGDQARQLLYALPASVRRVTLIVAIPEHIDDLMIVSGGLNSLLQEVFWLLCTQGFRLYCHRTHAQSPASTVGVEHIKVTFPLGADCRNMAFWKHCVKRGQQDGLQMKYEKDRAGMIIAIVFNIERIKNEGSLVLSAKDWWEKTINRVLE
ncbi:hypothetical protein EJ07DRAFT_152479 [Lizonia empirigonia]|nr:hypothetical protein EJ07DRAFT_152479 [Lizonia empirigonia]